MPVIDFIKAKYELPTRIPDFYSMQPDGDKEVRVNYWIAELKNYTTFEVLYQYENGYFKENTAKIIIKNSYAQFTFGPDHGPVDLGSYHTNVVLKKMKAFIDESIEKELLDG